MAVTDWGEKSSPLWQCDRKKARPLSQLKGMKWSTIIPGYSIIPPLNTLILFLRQQAPVHQSPQNPNLTPDP